MDALDIASVVPAMLGLSILLLWGVLDWDDCLSEKSAWDTLAWFAVLVGMGGQLTNLGIISCSGMPFPVMLGLFWNGRPITYYVMLGLYWIELQTALSEHVPVKS
ncbi:hypothetical protein RJ639_039967 [Escallonia herrerae]|uniref:Uncharacterized protein n=1 Tax=Escallonia herrerae TaxID=1293975 RepID=A0AA88WLU3_9ASTE|nr:hypothetical protein RJ639_039967 [Escallonia herrerae]